LANIERTNQASDSTSSAVTPLASRLSERTACSEARRNRGCESVFLSSEIQATDSTHIGCTTNTIAASQAPGTRISASSSQRSRPERAWSAMLTM